MNSTANSSAVSEMKQYYIVCSLSGCFGLISLIVSVVIIITVSRSKRRLHTVKHLLMCNTCIASIVYCIVQSINYAVLIFFPWITSDVGCRWRGYVEYVSVSAATYSYLVQATSRLFFSVLSRKHPWLTTFKAHYVLIVIHWLVVIIISSPSVITNDIYFRPGLLCLVPFERTVHLLYTVVACYCLPVCFIVVIYIYIFKRVKRSTAQAGVTLNTTNNKRDLEVLRNIVILLFIYISGGIPTVIFIISGIDAFYFAGIATFTFTVAVEKLCTIKLDRELRQTVRGAICFGTPVVAFENSATQPQDKQHVLRSQRH